MKTYPLRAWIFLALCCDLGLFAKRMVNPFANLITDALHIPGGIGTGFSLMFLVVAAALTRGRFCGAIMGTVQSALAWERCRPLDTSCPVLLSIWYLCLQRACPSLGGSGLSWQTHSRLPAQP